MRYLLIALIILFLSSCGKSTIEESHVCFTKQDCLAGHECKFQTETGKDYGSCVELEACKSDDDCSNSNICNKDTEKCTVPEIIISSEVIEDANMKLEYSFNIEFSGVKEGHFYFEKVDDLPEGLSLSEEGLISGTPEVMGEFSFKVRLYGQSKETKVYYGERFIEKLLSIKIIGDICNVPSNPCVEENKTVCTEDEMQDTGYTCSCDENYIMVNDVCTRDLCKTENDPSNPCVEDDKSVCTINEDNTEYTCACDEGFYENSLGVCLEDKCNGETNPCTENNRTLCVNDETETEGYKCSCDEGLVEYEGVCIGTVCDPNPCNHSIKNICVVDLSQEENYRCDCKENFYKDEEGNCQYNYCEVTKPCDANTETFKTKCRNDVSNENSYVCECNDRYDTDEEGNCFYNPCKPNRCNEAFKTVCTLIGSQPYGEADYNCECDEGYVLNSSGNCFPVGDLCETALEISEDIEYEGDNRTMHADHVATCGSYARSKETVYSFTLTENRLVTATMTSNETTPFNTALHIKDSCESTSNEIACSDTNDGDVNSSKLDKIYMTPGTYYLFADGSGTTSNGAYKLKLETENPCYADTDCSDETTFCDLDSHICKENKCLTSELACENGLCNRLDATCSCNEGFINSDDFTCIPDPCFNTICHENSVCVPSEDLSTYTCDCNEGFLETSSGRCLQNPCAPNNSCTEQNKNKCSYNILEDSIDTICSCNTHFTEIDGICTATVMNTCPGMVINPNQTLTGDTTTLENSYEYRTSPSFTSAKGNDAVYQFTLTKRSAVKITMASVGVKWDQYLHLRKTCSSDSNESQLARSDKASSQDEVIEEDLDAGTYYFIADGYSSTKKGEFSVKLEVEALCQTNSDCSGDHQSCNTSTERCECSAGFGFGFDLECYEECIDLGSSNVVCANPMFECNEEENLCYRKTECDETCQLNSHCDIETLECICDEGFTVDEVGSCTQDLCIENSVTCTGSNVSCNGLTGLCTCDEGYENYSEQSGCVEDTDPCTPGTKCSETNKTVCSPTSVTEYECLCDEGFIENNEGSCIDNKCEPNPCGNNSVCNLDASFNSVCSCKPGFELVNNICVELEANSCNHPKEISLINFSDSISSNLGNSQDLSCQTGSETFDKIYQFTIENSLELSINLNSSSFNGVIALSKGCNSNFMEVSCGSSIPNMSLNSGTYFLHVKSDNIGDFDIEFTKLVGLTLTNTSLKDAVLNSLYDEAFDIIGGTAPYIVELKPTSTLPDGLSITNNRLVGTPTNAGQTNNSFTVIVTDDNGNGISKEFTITLEILDNTLALKPQVGDLLINEIYFKASSDANNDGTTNSINDEFIEIVNISYKNLNLENVSLWDSIDYSYRHTFTGTLLPGNAIVVFGGGNLASLLETNTVFVSATSGNLSLKDSGDTIRIVDENSLSLESVSYTDESTNGSINRNPDLSRSSFSKHTEVTIDENNLYSPGKKSNGDSF